MTNLHIIAVFLLALSSNLDNVGIGVSYGVRRIYIPFHSNLIIALITSTGTFVSMAVGSQITTFINPNIANAMGALMIGGTGVWIFIQEISRREEAECYEPQPCRKTNLSNQSFFGKLILVLEHPFLADRDFSGHISMKEALLLGLALTLNNVTNGVGAGLLGLNAVLTTGFVMIFSVVTIWFGVGFGQYSGTRWFGKLAGPISGLMLISIGIYEYLA
jgi:putative sporulation protein YtaF